MTIVYWVVYNDPWTAGGVGDSEGLPGLELLFHIF